MRVALAKPTAAAFFLMVNGVILLGAEHLRRRADVKALAERAGPRRAGAEADHVELQGGRGIGVAQSTALIAGISRDGVCMTAGLLRGLDNEDSARFAFLLATPIILAAGMFKLPDLTGPLGAGIRGQASSRRPARRRRDRSVHWLLRYFKTRNLTPFGIYCLVFGFAMVIYTTT